MASTNFSGFVHGVGNGKINRKITMEGCLAGDASHVLNACGAVRPGFRLHHPSAKKKKIFT